MWADIYLVDQTRVPGQRGSAAFVWLDHLLISTGSMATIATFGRGRSGLPSHWNRLTIGPAADLGSSSRVTEYLLTQPFRVGDCGRHLLQVCPGRLG